MNGVLGEPQFHVPTLITATRGVTASRRARVVALFEPRRPPAFFEGDLRTLHERGST